jgi:Domain of unknown function (DUF4129)
MLGQWRAPVVRGALVLMEALWIYALVALVVAITVGGGKPSFLGVLVLVGGAFTISRVLQGSVMSLGMLRILGATLSLLLFYAVVRVDFYGNLAFWDFHWLDELIRHTHRALRVDSPGATAVIGVPLLTVFWVRGILTGQQSITLDDVLSSFAMGVLIVAGVLVAGSFVDELPRGVELIAVPYIAVGLLALGLTQAARANDSVVNQFMPGWMLAIGGVIGFMALIALLFIVIDFGTARDALGQLVYGVAWVGAGILYILAWPVIKILEGIFWVLSFGIGGLYQREIPTPQDVPQGSPITPEQGDNVLPGWLRLIVRYGIAGVLIVAAVIATGILFQRLQRRTEDGEQKESVYQEGRLAADLGNLFGSMFGRRRGGRVSRATEPTRRLYFDMLTVAERRGVERLPIETPLELAPRLETAFHSVTPAEITGLFDDVRYGGHEPSAEEVQRLRAQWEGLQEP